MAIDKKYIDELKAAAKAKEEAAAAEKPPAPPSKPNKTNLKLSYCRTIR